MTKVMIAQSAVVKAYDIVSFAASDSTRIVQFNPQVGVGFSGSVVLEASQAPTPSDNDFTEFATFTFTGHTENLTVEIQNNAPSIRARIVTSSVGAIAVFADSVNRSVQGSQGASPFTAYIETASPCAGSGASFKINTPVVPSFTTDDVYYANDYSKSLTDILDGTNGSRGKQDKIGDGNVLASDIDLNVLAGSNQYGLTVNDIHKLADVNVSAAELNALAGITGPIKAQIDNLAASAPASLAGITTTAAVIDAFFDAPSTVTVSNIANLSGLTATSADLNVFTGTANTFVAADLAKLGQVTATAAELNKLAGVTASSTDLNKLSGLTTSVQDLNALAGFGASGVTVTQLGYLSGLTGNIQTTLAAMPDLNGLSASVQDLNVLRGIATGSGSYANPVSSTEVSHLNGVVSNIQAQLDSKRDKAVTIGVSEISGASITTTELNYLQGARANIQAQIDGLQVGTLTSAGGSLTGQLFMAHGSAIAPGLGFVAPNQNTGFYKFGVNGMGITVNGARFASFDGVDFQIGPNGMAGEPVLKGVGFGLTDPAFSFKDDEDTGMNRMGEDSVGIIAGAEPMIVADANNDKISIGGHVPNNNDVVVDGVFGGEKLLGREMFQAGSTNGAIGNKTLYTVPVGRNVIITKVLVYLKNVTNFSNGSLFRFNMGTGPTVTELCDNSVNDDIFNPPTYPFSTAGQVITLGNGVNDFAAIASNNGADYQMLVAGTPVIGRVEALAGADEFDIEVFVLGVEFK